MADKEKQATCPICGYTDTAMDAQALEDAMAEHMRMQHNQAAPVNSADTDLKETGRRGDWGNDWVNPAVPAVPGAPTVPPGTIVAPGNNVGPNEIP